MTKQIDKLLTDGDFDIGQYIGTRVIDNAAGAIPHPSVQLAHFILSEINSYSQATLSAERGAAIRGNWLGGVSTYGQGGILDDIGFGLNLRTDGFSRPKDYLDFGFNSYVSYDTERKLKTVVKNLNEMTGSSYDYSTILKDIENDVFGSVVPDYSNSASDTNTFLRLCNERIYLYNAEGIVVSESVTRYDYLLDMDYHNSYGAYPKDE